MNENEKQMTGEESLSIIAGMINRAKNRFSETGHLYLLWGWVILVCCITQFVSLQYFNYEKGYQVWFLTWLAVIYQFIYLAKTKKREKVKTYTDEIMGFVWLTFMICGVVMVFILIKLKVFVAINPLILVLYGMPTFLSGIILKYKPLIFGGISCWVLAVLSPLVPLEYHLLLLACAVIAAWIIPGYLLRSKYKKENI
ncbi:MAG TPA: hypothetical protein VGP43_09700 [Chitinophagaceae bacterium]|nr:hypothetical protein [Chitinophagaceae bacterium]